MGIRYATAAAGKQAMVFMASLIGNANGTFGFLQVFNETNQNPGSIMEQTTPNNTGINTQAQNPLGIPKDGTLVEACMVVAHAAVSQASTGGAMTARIDLYKELYASRSLVTSLDMPITSAGISNNLGGDNYQVSKLTGLSVPIEEGILGAQFTNRSANNNEIDALGGIYFSAIIEFD